MLLLSLYPDYHRELVRVLDAGEVVVAEWVMNGSGSRVRGTDDLSIAGCTIAEVDDNVITRASLCSSDDSLDSILAKAGSAVDERSEPI